MKTKITYVGPLPDGHVIGLRGETFKFKRGETIEVPRDLAIILEKQSPTEWRVTDAIEKAAKEKA